MDGGVGRHKDAYDRKVIRIASAFISVKKSRRPFQVHIIQNHFCKIKNVPLRGFSLARQGSNSETQEARKSKSEQGR